MYLSQILCIIARISCNNTTFLIVDRSCTHSGSKEWHCRDSCSVLWQLSCGVPQGCILSLMLFNICMKTPREVIQSFEVGCHQYGDDIQL